MGTYLRFDLTNPELAREINLFLDHYYDAVGQGSDDYQWLYFNEEPNDNPVLAKGRGDFKTSSGTSEQEIDEFFAAVAAVRNKYGQVIDWSLSLEGPGELCDFPDNLERLTEAQKEVVRTKPPEQLIVPWFDLKAIGIQLYTDFSVEDQKKYFILENLPEETLRPDLEQRLLDAGFEELTPESSQKAFGYQINGYKSLFTKTAAPVIKRLPRARAIKVTQANQLFRAYQEIADNSAALDILDDLSQSGPPEQEPDSPIESVLDNITLPKHQTVQSPTLPSVDDISPGFHWNSPDGERRITEKAGAGSFEYFKVQTQGATDNSIILAKDILKTIAKDQAATQPAEQDTPPFKKDKPEPEDKEFPTLPPETVAFNGFIDTLAQSRKDRVTEALSKIGKDDLTRAKIVEDLVVSGHTVENHLVRGRKKRVLVSPGNEFLETLSKIELDYAAHLVNQNQSKAHFLPEGWTESAPGRIMTNRDPVYGGIIDTNIASGKWFGIPHHDNASKVEGLDTREEAYHALNAEIQKAIEAENSTLDDKHATPGVYYDEKQDKLVHVAQGTQGNYTYFRTVDPQKPGTRIRGLAKNNHERWFATKKEAEAGLIEYAKKRGFVPATQEKIDNFTRKSFKLPKIQSVIPSYLKWLVTQALRRETAEAFTNALPDYLPHQHTGESLLKDVQDAGFADLEAFYNEAQEDGRRLGTDAVKHLLRDKPPIDRTVKRPHEEHRDIPELVRNEYPDLFEPTKKPEPSVETENPAMTKKERIKAAKPYIETLAGFVSNSQLRVMKDLLAGEEGEYFFEKIEEYATRIQTMAKTYEQDGKGDEAIAYLHYFYGGSDWYITEKDMENEQIQAFGYTVLNGDLINAELGYINLQELTRFGAEIDIHWEPQPLKIVKKLSNKEPEPDQQALKNEDSPFPADSLARHANSDEIVTPDEAASRIESYSYDDWYKLLAPSKQIKNRFRALKGTDALDLEQINTEFEAKSKELMEKIAFLHAEELTITNIATRMNETDPEKAATYQDEVRSIDDDIHQHVKHLVDRKVHHAAASMMWGEFDLTEGDHVRMVGRFNQELENAEGFIASVSRDEGIVHVDIPNDGLYQSFIHNLVKLPKPEAELAPPTEIKDIPAHKQPSTVFREIRDNNDQLLGYLYTKYDGQTKEDALEKAGELSGDKVEAKYPDFSNMNSRIGATDEQGNPLYTISPNLNHAHHVTKERDQAMFTWKDKDAGRRLKENAVSEEKKQEQGDRHFDKTKEQLKNTYADQGYTLHYKFSDDSWHLTNQKTVQVNGEDVTPGEVRLTREKHEFLDVEDSIQKFETLLRPATELESDKHPAILPYKDQKYKAAKYIGKLLNDLGVAEEIANSENYHRIIFNEGYTPLTIKRHGNMIHLAHEYEQDDNSVKDGEMVFEVYPAHGYLVLKETAVHKPLVLHAGNPLPGFNGVDELRGCDHTFANMFAKNLNDQGFGQCEVVDPRRETLKKISGSEPEFTADDFEPSNPKYYELGGRILEVNEIGTLNDMIPQKNGKYDLEAMPLAAGPLPETAQERKATLAREVELRTERRKTAIEKYNHIKDGGDKAFKLLEVSKHNTRETYLAHQYLEILYSNSWLKDLPAAIAELDAQLHPSLDHIEPDTTKVVSGDEINMQFLLKQGGLPQDPDELIKLLERKQFLNDQKLNELTDSYERLIANPDADRKTIGNHIENIADLKGRQIVFEIALEEQYAKLDPAERMVQ